MMIRIDVCFVVLFQFIEYSTAQRRVNKTNGYYSTKTHDTTLTQNLIDIITILPHTISVSVLVLIHIDVLDGILNNINEFRDFNRIHRSHPLVLSSIPEGQIVEMSIHT